MAIAKTVSACLVASILAGAIYCIGLLFHDEAIYWQRGEQTSAMVFEKEVELNSSLSTNPGRTNGGQSRGLYWHYAFEHEGERYEKRDMSDVGRGFDDVAVGDVIDVIYDPQAPARSRAVAATPVLRYSGIAVFILAMAGLLAFMPLRILTRG